MSSNKKLCIATGIFPPDTGGPAKFAASFADWAARKSIYLSIISLTDGLPQKTQYSGSEVELISRRLSFLRRFIKSSSVLRKRMRSGEIVLANGLFLETYVASLFSSRAKYITKVPGDIVWERARNAGYTKLSIDEFQRSRISLKWRIFRWLFTSSLKRSQKVIAPSQHILNLCATWSLPREQVIQINNSIDIDKFSSNFLPKNWDVITVCRLVPWKGVEEIIRVCARLGMSLCVVGDGPERKRLEEISKILKAKVTFLGNQSENEVKVLLDQSRCFVLNSSFEATSYALLEARSMNLFSIARRNTGSEEVIKHEEDGLLCDESYPLYKALERFKADDKFVQSASSAARVDTSIRFSQEKNFANIYRVATE